MKTKTITLLGCMVLITALSTSAQTITAERSRNSQELQLRSRQPGDSYSFHLFVAPNKSFGYDILRNDKLVFHQPAFSGAFNDRDLMLIKKEQANTAALLAIEKIRKGVPPELSRDELKNITAR